MKKQLILLLVASATISNLDAAATYNRFYNWCINNRSRIAFATGAALSSGAAAYYWNNRNQQLIDEELSNRIWEIRNRPKVVPKKEVETSYSETMSGPDVLTPIVDSNTGQVEHWIQPGGLIPLRPIKSEDSDKDRNSVYPISCPRASVKETEYFWDPIKEQYINISDIDDYYPSIEEKWLHPRYRKPERTDPNYHSSNQ